MRKYPRIEINQKAYDGLQIEAVLRNKTAREIATNSILGYISKEALMVLDHKTYEDTKPAEPPMPSKSRTRPTQAGKQLARDATKVAEIKELWASSDLPIAEIARRVGGKRQTVDSIIKRLIEHGELAQRA